MFQPWTQNTAGAGRRLTCSALLVSRQPRDTRHVSCTPRPGKLSPAGAQPVSDAALEASQSLAKTSHGRSDPGMDCARITSTAKFNKLADDGAMVGVVELGKQGRENRAVLGSGFLTRPHNRSGPGLPLACAQSARDSGPTGPAGCTPQGTTDDAQR